MGQCFGVVESWSQFVSSICTGWIGLLTKRTRYHEAPHRVSSLCILRGEKTPGEDGKLMHHIFEDIASASPDAPAIFYGGKTMSYGEVNKRADLVACRLQHEIMGMVSPLKTNRNPLICIAMPPSEKRIITILAAFKLHMGYLPVEPTIPPQRVLQIVREAKPEIIIYAAEYAGVVNKTSIFSESTRLLDYDLLGDKLKMLTTYQKGNDQDPLACVLYTSGSTGEPKGVRLRHSSVLNRLRWQWRQFPFTESEVGAAKTSLLFVDSITETWGCLLRKIPVVIIPRNIVQNPESFVKTVTDHGVTRLVVVPTLLKTLLLYLKMSDRFNMLSKLKLIVCSGETLPPSLAKQFFSFFSGTVLANYYGSTEVTGDVTYDVFQDVRDVEEKCLDDRMSIGGPIDNCTVYVVDNEMRPVAEGEIGEILMSGKNVADGYMKMEQADDFMENTIEKSGASPLFRSGDYGKIAQGRIYFYGRRDTQVKIRGQRVDLSEIDRLISSLSTVKDVVSIVCRPRGSAGTIVSFTVTEKNAKRALEASRLVEACRSSLPDYMVPTVVVLKEMPVQSHTGKIDLERLKDIYDETLIDSGCTETDDVNRNVVDVIASVTGVRTSRVKLSDNFFQIGGNSVEAVNAVAGLRNLGYAIEIGAFFAARTISEIVETIKTGLVAEAKTVLASRYQLRPLQPSDRKEIDPIVEHGMVRKCPLCGSAGIRNEDMRLFTDAVWEGSLASRLSHVVLEKKTGRIVAVQFNVLSCFDLKMDTMMRNSCMRKICLMLVESESSFSAFIKGNHSRWCEAELAVTLPELAYEENLYILELFEKTLIEDCRKRGMLGICSVNVNLVTQVLAKQLGYQSSWYVKVKDWSSPDGNKPFITAPDDAYISADVLLLT
ncbi:beta-alanyl-bioamine nonribosomal peptide synthetase ebony-like [Lineus longissimus]|uniref:beta-alanyl-bioamine nonribosomal peptide synthetase ebony-like n=1 Tax=Lineus longissimus TaxID=88925 RepID=UPI002B4CEC01